MKRLTLLILILTVHVPTSLWAHGTSCKNSMTPSKTDSETLRLIEAEVRAAAAKQTVTPPAAQQVTAPPDLSSLTDPVSLAEAQLTAAAQQQTAVRTNLDGAPRVDLVLKALEAEVVRIQTREQRNLRVADAAADLPKLIEAMRQLTLTPDVRNSIVENSHLLSRVVATLNDTPELIPDFITRDLAGILNSLLRYRIQKRPDFWAKDNFYFDRNLTFNTESVGDLLGLIGRSQELPIYIRKNPSVGLQLLLLASGLQVATHHLRLAEMTSVILGSIEVIDQSFLAKMKPADVFLLSSAFRNLKLRPHPTFQQNFHNRLKKVAPLLSFQNLLNIQLNLSFAGFSINAPLLDRTMDIYQYRYLQNRDKLGSLFLDERLRFFNSVAGTLFNHDSPTKLSRRFKTLFDESGLDIYGNKIFKVQLFYLFDYYVKGGRPEILKDLENTTLTRPLVLASPERPTGLETQVGQALAALFPEDVIVPEHVAHPWMPSVDKFVPSINSLFEIQGPYHNRLVIFQRANGTLGIERRLGNSFDANKYAIFRRLGYNVFELEFEQMGASTEQIKDTIEALFKLNH